MIRILQVVNCMNRGGIETFLMNVYRCIDRDLIQFDFLVHSNQKGDYDDEIHELGGRIFQVEPRAIGKYNNIKSLNTFFKNHTEYKIVHQHVSSLSYVNPLKIASRHDVPIRIVHSHSTKEGGSYIHKYIHYWNQFSIRKYATDYFACSDLAADWLYTKKQRNDKHFRIINNGINLSDFAFNYNMRNQIRKELGVEGKFVIGNVGRLVYPKNHTLLINIYKKIYELNKNSILLIVGDGELKKSLEEEVESLNLKGKVIFTGKRTDVANILQAMDVFVMTSHFEGLPVTLVEAQAAGLPCIVSDNVTKTVNITNLVKNISLEKDHSYWANEIIKIHKLKTNSRSIDINSMRDFDIKLVTEELKNYYTKRLKEKTYDKKQKN